MRARGEVVTQRVVALDHELARPLEVVHTERRDELTHPLVLRDDVARPSPNDAIIDARELSGGGRAQRADDGFGGRALGDAGCVL